MPSKEGDSITGATGINVLEDSPTGCHNLPDTMGATGVSILQNDSSTENPRLQGSPAGATRRSILQNKSAGRDSSTGPSHRRRHSWQDGATGGNVSQEGREAGAGGKALIHPQRHNLKHRFELLRTLGEGTYGKVKLACERSTGEQVAIKYVKKTKIRDDNDLARIRREIRILSSLTHQHIVNIRQVYEKKDRIVLVMDCAPGGELYEYLNTHRCLPETQTRRFFRQIVGAVHYIHQNGIVHRDLKLENIVLDQEGNVKIADFGLANYFTLNSTLNTFCGSPLYASPEIVNGKTYHGPEVDVWSLGVVLYTLSYGAMPFESSNLKVLRQQISSGHYAEPAQPCGAASLIRHMLTVNPARRATLPDILGHWWVNLGHDVTPDGREYRPLTQSLHKVTQENNLDLLTRPPPPGLHRVPGARSGRKSVDIALDDDELLRHIGQFSSSSRSLRRASQCPDTSDGGLFPWRHTIASSAEELPTRVTESSATPEQTEGPATEEQPKVPPNRSQEGLNLKSEPGPENEENDGKLIGITNEVVPGCEDNNTKLPMPDTPSSHQESQDSGLPHGQEGSTLNEGKTVGVFDSDRKPKRSILKRKGKFSGDYSSCCIPTDDAALRAGEEEDCPLCRSLPCDSNSLPSTAPSRNHPKRHQSADAPDFTESVQSNERPAQPSSPCPESLVTSQAIGENMSQFTPSVVPCPMHSGCPPVCGTTAVAPQPLPTQPSAVAQFCPLSTVQAALSESRVLSSQHMSDFQSLSLSSEPPTLPQAVLLPTEHSTVSQPFSLSADQQPNGHSQDAPLGALNYDSHSQPHPNSKVTLHNTLTSSPLDANLGAIPDSDGALVVDSSGSVNTTATDKCLPLDNQFAGDDCSSHAAALHVIGDLSASIIPSAVCICPVNADISKVVRRPKGILKNSSTSATANSSSSNTTTNSHNHNSRNSSLDDPRKRFSMGSLSSSSSADILDLSYDSGDCDQMGSRCFVAAVPGAGDSAWDGNSTLTDASKSTEAGNSDFDSLCKQAGDQDCFILDGDFTTGPRTRASLQNREQDSFTSEKVVSITGRPRSHSTEQGRPHDSRCVEGQFRAVPLIRISSSGDLAGDVGEDNDVGVGEIEDSEEGLHCNQQPIFQDNVFDFTEARQVLQKALNFLN